MNRQEKKEEILQQIEVLKKQVEELDQEFKVGDWVARTCGFKINHDGKPKEFPAGYVFRIRSVYPSGFICCDDSLIIHSLESIRHATPEEIEQAKLKEEFPYEKHELCMVKYSKYDSWIIATYIGNGEFKCTSRSTDSFEHHKPYKKEDWI